jgi:hypothetical protein
VIRILTETGLRVYKELAPLRKEQVDLANKLMFIADSKTAAKAHAPSPKANSGLARHSRSRRARPLDRPETSVSQVGCSIPRPSMYP